MTKAERVLRFIEDAPTGRTLIEIQTFIIEMNGIKDAINPKTGMRKHEHRGWYCTNLYENQYYGPGSGNSKVGLLLKYCTKMPSGRWVVTEPIEGPWYVMSTPTKSYLANKARKQGEHAARVAKYPVCPACFKARYPGVDSMPDNDGCLVSSSSSGYVTDCRERVWFRPCDDRDSRDILHLTDLKRDDLYKIESAFSTTFATWELRSAAMKNYVSTHVIRERS